MTGAPLAVGLIGCGWIAEVAHVPSLLKSRFGTLSAIADTRPDRLDLIGSRCPGATLYSDTESVLAIPHLDVIVIATPPETHLPLATAAFRAGKHVLVEKPLATNVADAEALVVGWRAAGTTAEVGYNFRRSPVFEAACKAVRAGELGDILAVQSRFLWAAEALEGWRTSAERGGGVVLDLASHHIDLARIVTGHRLTRVRCRTESRRFDEDFASMEFETDRGASVQVVCSSAAGTNENSLEVVGTDGSLRVDLLDARSSPVRGVAGTGARARRILDALAQLHPARLLRSPGFEPSFARTMEAFLESVVTGRSFAPSPIDGLRAMAVAEAALASARAKGVPVEIPSIGLEP